MMEVIQFQMSGTSPAAAGTSVLATLNGLQKFDYFTFDAVLTGATGGVLDLYIQRKVATDVWLDWCRFTQLTAGNAEIRYSFSIVGTNTITTVGKFADAGTGTAVLASGTFLGGHPGTTIRLLAVAGASTSAGAVQTIYVNAFKAYS